MDVIDKIIENIPILLIYFIPGYCTVFLYNRFSSKQSAEGHETIHLGICVVISYVIQMLFECVHPLPKGADVQDSIGRCFAGIAVGFFLAFAASKLRKNNRVRMLYSKVFENSLSDTVFKASNLHGCPYVTIYGEDVRISGRAVLIGDESDPWIALDYYQVSKTDEGMIDVWHNHETYTRYLIPFSGIKSMVIHYKKSDKTFTTEQFLELRKKKEDNPLHHTL